MSFLISKILWSLVSPVMLLMWLLALAWLLRRMRPRLSAALLGSSVLFLAAAGLTPLAYWVVTPLQSRFPQPVLPEKVDGVIVLGGAMRTDNALRHHQAAFNEAAERITETAALARRYPQAKIVFTGGSGEVRRQGTREADVAGPTLIDMGVNPANLILERDSRNTWENALFTKALVKPAPGETWLLVTSAWHMPRSAGIFRKAGWQVIPYPVDYISDDASWLEFNGEESLGVLGVAEKEWIGLVAYHLMGRTDALFPAPAPPP